MNIVTIREFNRKMYQYLKECRDITVTKDDKPFFVVTFCRDNSDVVTKDLPSDVVTKQKVISTLKQTIHSVKDKPTETETFKEVHWCFNCQKFGRRNEAVESVLVYEDGRVKEIWLCGVCKSRHSVCV